MWCAVEITWIERLRFGSEFGTRDTSTSLCIRPSSFVLAVQRGKVLGSLEDEQGFMLNDLLCIRQVLTLSRSRTCEKHCKTTFQ